MSTSGKLQAAAAVMQSSDTKRSVEAVFQGAPLHWVGDGFRVTNYMPTALQSGNRMSPFFLLDYQAPLAFAATSNLRRGVGPHPHRGFETVTIALAGSVAHHDSAGNGGVIGPGDAQWMTAGAGILHKEYHEAAFAKQGGTLHMLQLWVNLPAKHKMTTPKYQALLKGEMGVRELPDGGLITVIAGDYAGTKGPASTFTPMTVLLAKVSAGTAVPFVVPASHNAGILVLSGDAQVSGGPAAKAGDFVLLRNDADSFSVVGLAAESEFILLSGEPIDEPLVASGPFLMNSRREISQAIADFTAGKFGELDE